MDPVKNLCFILFIVVQETGSQISEKRNEKKQQVFMMLNFLSLKFFSSLLKYSFDEMIEVVDNNF